jgi:hypothetical protein
MRASTSTSLPGKNSPTGREKEISIGIEMWCADVVCEPLVTLISAKFQSKYTAAYVSRICGGERIKPRCFGNFHWPPFRT